LLVGLPQFQTPSVSQMAIACAGSIC